MPRCTRSSMMTLMDNKLPDTVLDTRTTRNLTEPFGPVHFYFEGKTDLLSSMTVGSLILHPGMEPHPPHQHPEEEFMLVTEGTGIISVEDTVYEVGPGSMMYCAGNNMHGIRNTGDVPMTFYFHKWLA